MSTNYGKYNKKPSLKTVDEPLDETQVKNDAGGYVFSIDKWKMLRRFLILGSEGGTFYASEKDLTKRNIDNLLLCIKDDGERVLKETIEVSQGGLAPKNDPAIFVMAMLLTGGNSAVKYLTRHNITKVCRIGTHILQLAGYLKMMRGWGRGIKNTFLEWYKTKFEEQQLPFQVLKYQKRERWSHRDIFRLIRPKISDPKFNAIIKWVVKDETGDLTPELITDYKCLVDMTNKELSPELNFAELESMTVALIKKHRYSWEMVPTTLRKSIPIWKALLPNLGLIALVRNLGNLGKYQVLTNEKFEEPESIKREIIAKLSDVEAIKKSRIHPLQALKAIKTYAKGRGIKGSGTWNPVREVIIALENLFEESFKQAEPTGKKILIALDVSGSMSWDAVDGVLTPREICAAIALTIARREKSVDVVGFSHDLTLMPTFKTANYEQALNLVDNLTMGGTDCALPAIWAKNNNKDYDAIIVFTDNETWVRNIHPSEAIKQYRSKIGHDCKFIVCATTATNFTIADPKDKSMLDIVGYDSSIPQIIDAFIKDEI